MNMIVAGDGHNNIRCADSLNQLNLIPSYKSSDGTRCKNGKAHLILTNPPFGTSEAESLTPANARRYAVKSTKGQSLFIQKMIDSASPDSLIVTVIDEGVLNTASYEELRRHILKTCRLETVLMLPDETFKPNKINVKSSVLVLRRREDDDEDAVDDYPVAFVELETLGYEGSGQSTRGFDEAKLISEVSSIDAKSLSNRTSKSGYCWSAFSVDSETIASEKTARFDVRYWCPSTRLAVEKLGRSNGVQTIEGINLIPTKRGKSPPAAEYVSDTEGHAVVVKSGSNLTKAGNLNVEDADYIELPLYQDYVSKSLTLEDGDILLASTGDGTLGKCCVYRNEDEAGLTKPAVADGHVTVIRVDPKKIHPEYLCDYLRKGFGHDQLNRIFTGSTGMVELTPDDVDMVLLPPFPPLKAQRKVSNELRKSEQDAARMVVQSEDRLFFGLTQFREATALSRK
jgi:type I restriction enzyme M protein